MSMDQVCFSICFKNQLRSIRNYCWFFQFKICVFPENFFSFQLSNFWIPLNPEEGMNGLIILRIKKCKKQLLRLHSSILV